MKKIKSLIILMMLCTSIRSHATELSGSQELIDPGSPVICRVTEPYLVEPYKKFSLEKLKEEFKKYIEFPIDPRVYWNNEVDTSWVVLADLYQSFHILYPGKGPSLDTEFTILRSTLRSLSSDCLRSHDMEKINRQFFLFWKRAAWVHPDDAEALAYAFANKCFSHKIPQKPEFADFWKERAKILKEKSWWHLPTDRDPRKEDIQFGINRLYSMLKSKG